MYAPRPPPNPSPQILVSSPSAITVSSSQSVFCVATLLTLLNTLPGQPSCPRPLVSSLCPPATFRTAAATITITSTPTTVRHDPSSETEERYPAGWTKSKVKRRKIWDQHRRHHCKQAGFRHPYPFGSRSTHSRFPTACRELVFLPSAQIDSHPTLRLVLPQPTDAPLVHTFATPGRTVPIVGDELSRMYVNNTRLSSRFGSAELTKPVSRRSRLLGTRISPPIDPP